MENRKELIEKELKQKQKKIQDEIELLKQEKEKYGFDYDAIEKTLNKKIN